MQVKNAIWQAYYAVASAGFLPPILTIFMSWRYMTKRQIIKRILIGIGIFWAFNMIIGALMILGYLPKPPGY